jgi:feruloyl esterase
MASFGLRIAAPIAAFLFAGAAQAEDCQAIGALVLPHATVTQAASFAKGAEIAKVGEQILTAPLDFCRVQITSRPTDDSDIRIELWVPLETAWNGKFTQLGNGGFAGEIPLGSMAAGLASGYAVAGTDDGHQSAQATDASWALGHPEKIVDYGWRAIDETRQASQFILAKLKNKAPARSYFRGCSDGGREALMMAERFPDAFDGIIAGAPASNMSRLLTGGGLRARRHIGPAGYLTPANLRLLQKQALQQCGAGLGYLQDPSSCKPDLAALRCEGAATDSCLTDAQIETARSNYQDHKDPTNGATIYGVMPGAEAVANSWGRFLTAENDTAKAGYAWNYFAYMVKHDPQLDPTTLSDADLARAAKLYRPIMDSDDADLTAFKAHGGKLIQYHGWNDPLIPPGFSLEYQSRLAAQMGNIDGFYRLYMVPGMLHCGGGDAPTNVNWLAALEDWVERNKAPGTLTASDGKGATQTIEPRPNRP